MQYAVMYAAEILTREQLLSYKDGRRGGLEAHADLYMDTGSLGQCLSATVGTALLRSKATSPLAADAEQSFSVTGKCKKDKSMRHL